MGRGVRRGTVRTLVGAAMLLTIGGPSAHAAPPVVEPWVPVAVTTYPPAQGLYLTQGIASDGASLFFSYKFGVLRAGLDGTLASPVSPSPIPPAMVEGGSDHVGDIDVHAGNVYAPIEDGDGYPHAYLALYDAATMAFTGTSWELPHDLLTAGVPWVAVDAPRGKLYTAEWDDPRVLNVHDLDDPTVVTTVELHPPAGVDVSRIQGAKMLDGLLYAARDNGAEKSIVAIDPVSGDVTPVFDRDLGAATEAEGIAFVHTPTGVLMCTTEIAPGLSVKLRVYRRQSDPATGAPTACVPTPPTPPVPDPGPAPVPDPAPGPAPQPVPTPKPVANPLTVATARLVRGARVQTARGTTGKPRWTTVSRARSGGRSAYRVRVVNGSRVLSTGTVKGRRLTLSVRHAITTANLNRVASLVVRRLRDVRSVRVLRTAKRAKVA